MQARSPVSPGGSRQGAPRRLTVIALGLLVLAVLLTLVLVAAPDGARATKHVAGAPSISQTVVGATAHQPLFEVGVVTGRASP